MTSSQSSRGSVIRGKRVEKCGWGRGGRGTMETRGRCRVKAKKESGESGDKEKKRAGEKKKERHKKVKIIRRVPIWVEHTVGMRRELNESCLIWFFSEQGDSGGPLQVPMTNWTCMMVQVGITSRGPSYCANKVPAIYTRVSNYLPWIQRIVWPEKV